MKYYERRCELCGNSYETVWRRTCFCSVECKKRNSKKRFEETKEIRNLRRRKQYLLGDKKEWTHKYEKTKKGFLVRKYRNMQSRVLGIQKLKAHLYLGKELLPRIEFYKWAYASNDFHFLYENWVSSGYNRKLCPSVNRINSKNGYVLSNMEWITHSENSSRTSKNQMKI